MTITNMDKLFAILLNFLFIPGMGQIAYGRIKEGLKLGAWFIIPLLIAFGCFECLTYYPQFDFVVFAFTFCVSIEMLVVKYISILNVLKWRLSK